MMVKLWTLDTSWVIVGLISFFILGGMGEMINARRITTIADTVSGASDGSLPATLRSQINDPILWTAVFADAAGLLGVIFLMTLKPGLVGSIVTMLIALGVGAAIGQVFVRREVEAPAGARA
jgi:uncharacterized membrane protein